ncbi:MAG TPA: ATP-binding protein [Gemmatimonadaceae bacterium]|nr:ATP-binding protein [Gemmatimonadaceae bacterium]
MAAPDLDRVRVSQNVAASIAHELRNPVFAIASAVQLLRYRITDDPVIEKNLGRILRESERLNAFVAALLEYGRPAPVRLEPADPDDVWVDVLATRQGALESKALKAEHDAPPIRARCNLDAEQLANAFTIVLDNAIEAATPGTDLSIVSAVLPDGSWRSHLTNRGERIAQDVLEHAFEPLVTTKHGHTGIGLAIAHRVVADHGGTIALASGDDSTSLTLTLPPAPAPLS